MAELERDTLKALKDYLIKHGYPKSSIVVEWKVGNYQIDLAIIDPDTNLPVQIFEVKSTDNHQIEKMGKEQLKTLLQAIKKLEIPAYLVFPKTEAPYFKAKKIDINFEKDDMTTEEISPEGVFDYTLQRYSRIFEKINENKEEKKKTIDEFKRISTEIAILVLFIFFLDLYKILNLSNTQLYLFAAFLFFLLMPYASKLKILGIEFERLNKSK